MNSLLINITVGGNRLKNGRASKAAFCWALLFLSWPEQARVRRIRLECKTHSADGLIGIDGECNEQIGRRQQLNSSFEAAPGIEWQLHGAMQLLLQANGGIAGDLDFFSNIEWGDADTSAPSPGTRLMSERQVSFHAETWDSVCSTAHEPLPLISSHFLKNYLVIYFLVQGKDAPGSRIFFPKLGLKKVRM